MILDAPKNFLRELNLPADVTVNASRRKPVDCALLFVKTEKELLKQFGKLTRRLKPAGMLWVAWPKKSSGVETDLSFSNVQAIGLGSGLVDTKICAINETWSGLKFVFRLKDRDDVLRLDAGEREALLRRLAEEPPRERRVEIESEAAGVGRDGMLERAMRAGGRLSGVRLSGVRGGRRWGPRGGRRCRTCRRGGLGGEEKCACQDAVKG